MPRPTRGFPWHCRRGCRAGSGGHARRRSAPVPGSSCDRRFNQEGCDDAFEIPQSWTLVASASPAVATSGGPDVPDRGLEPVNVPVVTRSRLCATTPPLTAEPWRPAKASASTAGFAASSLATATPSMSTALFGHGARSDVAQVAGNYGLMVADGAPVTARSVASGHRSGDRQPHRASVPNCPTGAARRSPTSQQPHHVQLRLRSEFEHRRDGRQPRGPGPWARRHRRRRRR